MFYKRVQDAQQDGYSNFKPADFSNANGYLYSFTGLRGDAKELYRQVVRGEEKRVQFIKTVTVEEQSPFIKEADLVIWACGYQTNFIPVYELGAAANVPSLQLKALQFSQLRPGTQFDVDNKCRLMLANGVVLSKVFACGIGYPVRTNDGKTVSHTGMDKEKQKFMKAQNPRADGFSLYLNIVGDILLKNILQKEKKKSAGHKIYPLVANAESNHKTGGAFLSPFKVAVANVKSQHSPPGINAFSTKKLAIKDTGNLIATSKPVLETTVRFKGQVTKRQIKSSHSQSRQPKQKHRSKKISQLHQYIASEHNQAGELVAMEPIAENDQCNLEDTLVPPTEFIQLQSHELVAKAPFIISNQNHTTQGAFNIS